MMQLNSTSLISTRHLKRTRTVIKSAWTCPRERSFAIGERLAEPHMAESLRGLQAMHGRRCGEVRPSLRQKPRDIYPDAATRIAAEKWSPRNCLVENGGTKQRPGSGPARKFSPALAQPARSVPSAREPRRTPRNGSSASLLPVLRRSNQVEHSESLKTVLAALNRSRLNAT